VETLKAQSRTLVLGKIRIHYTRDIYNHYIIHYKLQVQATLPLYAESSNQIQKTKGKHLI